MNRFLRMIPRLNGQNRCYYNDASYCNNSTDFAFNNGRTPVIGTILANNSLIYVINSYFLRLLYVDKHN